MTSVLTGGGRPLTRSERGGGRVLRSRKGFTLVEIMIVVGVIGLLAAIAIPSFAKARRTSRNMRFVSDLRLVCDAFAMYSMQTGRYPPDTVPPTVPTGVAKFLPRLEWSAPTSIGGNWDWDLNQWGYRAGVSVYKPDRTDAEMREIDAKIDDGSLYAGAFRKRTDGYIYIIEK